MVVNRKTLAVIAASIFTIAALAGETGRRNDGSRRIQLSDPALLSGVRVPPGAYTLSWARQPGSEEVRVEIARGKSVLATAEGLWIESAAPSPYEAVVYHEANGTNELAEIRFEGSPESIRIDAGATRAAARQTRGTDTN